MQEQLTNLNIYIEKDMQEKAVYLGLTKKKLIILTKRGHRSVFAGRTWSFAPNLLMFVESMLECDLICEESLFNGFEKSMWASVESDCNWDDLFCKII